ncbi:uncharacterized protein EI97DRAFT_318936 [Westerdykella ornata]|uniref:Uncharacterized protein n=1 Tax=Westerdykella ornata TaxID=318751 RepID=A0A6A6JJE8_WESOR|nr:uncharacterized protein EI97DRAFT_318936 [Westerdykella ornata]KAF2276701.1 hypothetical protein EI97DRAFT_318936 [Westerdykella ornata]
MPAQTRKSNKEANFKVYYTKKLPKQVYFPHRRKIVKRRDEDDDVGKEKQMRFLPERMRVRRQDIMRSSEAEDESDGESEAEKEAGERQQQQQKGSGKRGAQMQAKGGGKKRRSDVLAQDNDGELDTATAHPAAKRRRRPAKKTTRQSATTSSVHAASDEETEPQSPISVTASESDSESEQQREDRSRRRRQSTMTQLVEGRKPRPGEKEPEFKPVKRTSRNSWGSTRGKDDKQRTLTQMVRGMVQRSDSEDEDEDDGGVEIDSALAEHLAQSGLFEAAGEVVIDGDNGSHETGLGRGGKSVGEPTQDVRTPESPSPSRRRTSRLTVPPVEHPQTTSTPHKATQKRFSLLATPERRKVREIPSSQSPPETPLSTQPTPRSLRRPLSERTPNTQQKPLDTPSKRKKVAFQECVSEIRRPPPARRQFVQDSEDEDDNLTDDEENQEPELGDAIGPETQRVIYNIEHPATGKTIGAETQAMLEQIDRACEDAEGLEMMLGRQDSIELGVSTNRAAHHEGSQTVGGDGDTPDEPAPIMDQEEGIHNAALAQQQPHDPPFPHHERATSTPPPATPTPTPRPSNLPNHPPITIAIKHEPSTQTPHPSPQPNPHHPPTPTQTLLDLDGHPINAPGSPSPETQTSHSSSAEHQLQSEFVLSYSQFPPRMPPSSSMAVVGVGSDSYMDVLETPRRATGGGGMQEAGREERWEERSSLSQATTVDGDGDGDGVMQRSLAGTPRKMVDGSASAAAVPVAVPPGSATPRLPTRTTAMASTTPAPSRALSALSTPRSSHTLSAIATPQKLVPSSSPHTVQGTQISPLRPDTLVIPSSFPSPGKLSSWFYQAEVGDGMVDLDLEHEGLDGFGSVEDFSIPGLPPGTAEWEEEEV